MGPLAALTFQAVDWAVFLLFAAAILALGFSARLRESSALQFLTDGRRLTLPAFVATLVSTWYGGILGIGESVSYFGVGTWLLLGVPYYLFAFVFAIFLAERVRGVEQFTLPERLESAYGKPAAYVGAVLVFLLAVPAAHVLMLGVLVQQVVGGDLAPAIIGATLIGTAFLYRGGLLADVRVGFLAFVAMYMGFAAIAVFCIARMPLSAAVAALPDAGQRTFTGGQPWPVVLSFLILGAWTLVDPGFHQRVASAETPAVGRRGVLASVACWCLFDVLSITVALYSLAMLKNPPANPVAIFPAFAEEVLPPGLKAVFVCGMLGTILSAMVGYTLVAAGTVGRELVGRFRGDMDSAAVVRWTRAGISASSLAAVALAIRIESVVALWYAWSGCVIGALLIPVWRAYVGRSLRLGPWVAGSMVLSFLASFGWFVAARRTNNPNLEVAWIRTANGGYFVVPPIPEGLRAEAVVVGVGTLLPGLLVSGAILGLGWLSRRGNEDDR